MRDAEGKRSKQGHTNNKAKQHTIPKAHVYTKCTQSMYDEVSIPMNCVYEVSNLCIMRLVIYVQ